jgi:hypothetical protein
MLTQELDDSPYLLSCSAGRYVPFISAAMLDTNDKEYYDLSGMYDLG